MKQTVRIAGGIEELFGTLDENLKFLESSLRVVTHLKDHDLEIEGESAQVERAVRILHAYNDRVRVVPRHGPSLPSRRAPAAAQVAANRGASPE